MKQIEGWTKISLIAKSAPEIAPLFYIYWFPLHLFVTNSYASYFRLPATTIASVASVWSMAPLPRIRLLTVRIWTLDSRCGGLLRFEAITKFALPLRDDRVSGMT